MSPLSRSTVSKSSRLRIAITTGDPDGIGWEVTVKALNSLKPKRDVQFLVYRSKSGPVPKPKIKTLKTVPVANLLDALKEPFDSRTILEIRGEAPPALWVEEAAAACMEGSLQALVTAPLSKPSIIQAGLKDIGHTEILQRISGKPDLFMGFIGQKFNVLLGTGHQSLIEAVQSLNLQRLAKILKAAQTFTKLLPARRRNLPVALVGLNPHAGEGGLIGTDEGWMSGLIEDQRTRGMRVVGPLVPDAAFLPRNWPEFSTYICLYHDQGLIPFKMVHGFSGGVHVTLGLPFVRTSVDHGTAKELFGKNKADAGSMRDAIETAIRLYKEMPQ